MEYMNVIISVDYTIPSVSILIRFSDYGYGCISRAQLFKSIKLPFKNIFLFARYPILTDELFYICIIPFEIVRSYRLFLEYDKTLRVYVIRSFPSNFQSIIPVDQSSIDSTINFDGSFIELVRFTRNDFDFLSNLYELSTSARKAQTLRTLWKCINLCNTRCSRCSKIWSRDGKIKRHQERLSSN